MSGPPLMLQGSYCVRIHNGQRNSRPRPMRIQQRNCYALVALHDGNAVLHNEGSEQRVMGPAAFLLPPCHPATVDLHAGAKWDLVRFDVTDVPLRLVNNQQQARTHVHPQPQPSPNLVWGFTPPLLIRAAAVSECCRTVRLCGSSWWRGDLAYVRANARLQWWLTEYLTGLVQSSEAAVRHEDPWAEHVLTLARAGIDDGLTVNDLADQLGMSRAHLRRRLVSAGLDSPKHLLLRLRMERAAELLDRPNKARPTIDSLAGLCGYRSTAAFSRAFERYYGSPPGGWSGTTASPSHVSKEQQ